jgi:hypothetical protein
MAHQITLLTKKILLPSQSTKAWSDEKHKKQETYSAKISQTLEKLSKVAIYFRLFENLLL